MILSEPLNLKRSSYESVYFFIMIVYMGMANGYTQVLSYPPSKGLWTFFVPVILTITLVVRNVKKFRSNKRLYLVLCIVCIWVVFQGIKYMHLFAMNLFLLYNIVMAYIFVKVYGYGIIVLYERYVTKLSLIGLFVWIIYNLAPELLINFTNYFSVKCSGTLISNFFIAGLASSSDFIGFRNAGFAQEPGMYASFVIIAMFFNLILNGFNYKNRSFIILFLSLITTQSTTGYLAFFLIVFFYTLNVKTSRLYVILFLLLTLPSIIALPFVGDKIKHYMPQKDSIENIVWNGEYIENNIDGAVFVPQRLDGFILECMNFLFDPWLGYGVKKEYTSYVSTHLSRYISCSNGNISIFSRFGLFMGIFFYLILYRTGKLLDSVGNVKASLSFILMFLVLTISYQLDSIPMLLSLWLLSVFFDTNNNIRKY